MEIRSLKKQRALSGLWSEDEFRQGLDLLRYDSLYNRIPSKHLPALVEDSLSVGFAQADTLSIRYATTDPLVAAKEMGVRIVYDISSGASSALNIISSYQPKPPVITLHETVMRACRERLEKENTSDSRHIAALLTNICVAHELFHHIERTSSCFVNLGYKVAVLNLGFIKIEKSLAALSEIAAHAFAKRLLSLPCLPCALNPALFGEV